MKKNEFRTKEEIGAYDGPTYPLVLKDKAAEMGISPNALRQLIRTRKGLEGVGGKRIEGKLRFQSNKPEATKNYGGKPKSPDTVEAKDVIETLDYLNLAGFFGGFPVFNRYTQRLGWHQNGKTDSKLLMACFKPFINKVLEESPSGPYNAISEKSAQNYQELLETRVREKDIKMLTYDPRLEYFDNLCKKYPEQTTDFTILDNYTFGWDFKNDDLGVGRYIVHKFLFEPILRVLGFATPSMHEMVILVSAGGAFGKTQILSKLFPRKYTNVLDNENDFYGVYEYIPAHLGKMVVVLDELAALGSVATVNMAGKAKAKITADELEGRIVGTSDEIKAERTHVYFGTSNRIQCIPAQLAGDRRFLPLELAELTPDKQGENHPVLQFQAVHEKLLVAAYSKLKKYRERMLKAKTDAQKVEIRKQVNDLIPTFYDPANSGDFKAKQERFCMSTGATLKNYSFIESMVEAMDKSNVVDPENRPWYKSVLVEDLMGLKNRHSSEAQKFNEALRTAGWLTKRIRINKNNRVYVVFPPNYSAPVGREPDYVSTLDDKTAPCEEKPSSTTFDMQDSVDPVETYRFKNDGSLDPFVPNGPEAKNWLAKALYMCGIPGPEGSGTYGPFQEIIWSACSVCHDSGYDTEELMGVIHDFIVKYYRYRTEEFLKLWKKYDPAKGKYSPGTLLDYANGKIEYDKTEIDPDGNTLTVPAPVKRPRRPSKPVEAKTPVAINTSCLAALTPATQGDLANFFPPIEGLKAGIPKHIGENLYWHANYCDQNFNPDSDFGASCDKHFVAAHYLIYEIDNATLEKQIKIIKQVSEHLNVSFVVYSGNKSLHVYLKLDKPLHDMVEWEMYQGLLANWVGGDEKLINPGRLVRRPAPKQPCFKWGDGVNSIEQIDTVLERVDLNLGVS